MGLAEQRSDCRRRVGAHQPIGAAILEAQLLQTIEIAQQYLPFRRDARLAGKVVEIFLHGEGQERTEHMTADARIGRMENRPCAHDGLCPQEQIFDLKQIAIAKHGLQWRHIGVGAQHEDAVEPRLFGEFAGVDFKHPIAFVLSLPLVLSLVPARLRR